jgi:hypothetical protein
MMNDLVSFLYCRGSLRHHLEPFLGHACAYTNAHASHDAFGQ